jgi:hypothetical protein
MSDIDDLEEWLDMVHPARERPSGFRGRGNLKTHCKRGHELTPENTYVYENGAGGLRMCKKCHKLRVAARQTAET